MCPRKRSVHNRSWREANKKAVSGPEPGARGHRGGAGRPDGVTDEVLIPSHGCDPAPWNPSPSRRMSNEPRPGYVLGEAAEPESAHARADASLLKCL
jgi:hypothetical protein